MRQLLYGFKSDESLMLAYQRGDADAFEVLYMRHKDSLFNFLYRSLQQPALIEELAQDTWLAVIKGASRYRVDAKFRTYLYQIAHNRLVDHWRRAGHGDNNPVIGEGSFETCGRAELASAACHLNPEAQQLQSEILAAIARLPGEQQEAFLLREEGFSKAQIAEITGAGSETVKSRLRYASRQLRQWLGGEQ